MKWGLVTAHQYMEEHIQQLTLSCVRTWCSKRNRELEISPSLSLRTNFFMKSATSSGRITHKFVLLDTMVFKNTGFALTKELETQKSVGAVLLHRGTAGLLLLRRI
ncbi:hypothetical protein FHG87_003316 [Trinorchestia longiramus]|nr:hypothetical protein FHG87_003316 [Trinorchestia longiramus]